MNRRELVAGVASVGVLAGAGTILRRGVPFASGEPAADPPAETTDDEDETSGLELETIDARGSDAGTLPIPTQGVTLLMFFSPACGQCQALMPNLAAAQKQLAAEYGDALSVVSIAPQHAEDELREWWLEHDGDWLLGFDPGRTVGSNYRIIGYPVLALLDETGTKRWEENGVVETDHIVRNVERVLEEYTDRGDESANEGTEDGSAEDGDEPTNEGTEGESADDGDEPDEGSGGESTDDDDATTDTEDEVETESETGVENESEAGEPRA